MKTDSIFYRLFQELPGIFFELIGNSPQTAETYQFSSIEIKQTAFRIDCFLCQHKEKKIRFILLKSSFKLTQKFIHAYFQKFLYTYAKINRKILGEE
ncbi:DUF2887 domain-containing protein [Nostoc edaphicum]|uniref:DUF2887 domain-containing protein n=1 Tax=Nostoc edaphicum TaxID=264686 RepID=UPI0039083ACF